MRFIVLSPHCELRENVLFMMEASDERFDTPNYRPVTRIIGLQGQRIQIATGKNGRRYQVFPDWSAKEL
jgi:hypothetical protein